CRSASQSGSPPASARTPRTESNWPANDITVPSSFAAEERTARTALESRPHLGPEVGAQRHRAHFFPPSRGLLGRCGPGGGAADEPVEDGGTHHDEAWHLEARALLARERGEPRQVVPLAADFHRGRRRGGGRGHVRPAVVPRRRRAGGGGARLGHA